MPKTTWLQVDSNFVRFGLDVLLPIKPFPVTGRKKNQGITTEINPKMKPEKIEVSKISKTVRKK